MDEKTTVDPKEIKMFQDLSINWWEHDGLQLLKKVNATIIKYICEQMIDTVNGNYSNTSEALRGLKVLEVGCGGGFLSEDLARTGCDLTGIDPNISLLKVAKLHASTDPTLLKIKYIPETVEEYCEKHAGEFDVVISNFVLEHVSDPNYFIECCSKCVKSGGSLFLSAIAKTYLAWFIQIFLLEYVLRKLPIGVHQLEKFINASVTEDFIRSHGFKIKHTQGFFYDVLTKTVYCVPIHSYLYMTHAVKDNQTKNENKLNLLKKN